MASVKETLEYIYEKIKLSWLENVLGKGSEVQRRLTAWFWL